MRLSFTSLLLPTSNYNSWYVQWRGKICYVLTRCLGLIKHQKPPSNVHKHRLPMYIKITQSYLHNRNSCANLMTCSCWTYPQYHSYFTWWKLNIYLFGILKNQEPCRPEKTPCTLLPSICTITDSHTNPALWPVLQTSLVSPYVYSWWSSVEHDRHWFN